MSKPISRKFSGTRGEGAALISQLEARDEKFDEESVVAITQDASGKIIWLEKGHPGDRPSGLAHIIDAHGTDFARQALSTISRCTSRGGAGTVTLAPASAHSYLIRFW